MEDKNKELRKILNKIAKETGVSVSAIIKRKNNESRRIACHIVRIYYPDLMDDLSGLMKCHKSDICLEAASQTRIMNEDDASYKFMTALLQPFGLAPKKRAKDCNISDTKRLFGFDYTDTDKARQKVSMAEASVYMNKLCSLGRQPLEGVMIPQKKYIHEKWYND